MIQLAPFHVIPVAIPWRTFFELWLADSVGAICDNTPWITFSELHIHSTLLFLYCQFYSFTSNISKIEYSYLVRKMPDVTSYVDTYKLIPCVFNFKIDTSVYGNNPLNVFTQGLFDKNVCSIILLTNNVKAFSYCTLR